LVEALIFCLDFIKVVFHISSNTRGQRWQGGRHTLFLGLIGCHRLDCSITFCSQVQDVGAGADRLEEVVALVFEQWQAVLERVQQELYVEDVDPLPFAPMECLMESYGRYQCCILSAWKTHGWLASVCETDCTDVVLGYLE
jgi:hypothetical protein